MSQAKQAFVMQVYILFLLNFDYFFYYHGSYFKKVGPAEKAEQIVKYTNGQ